MATWLNVTSENALADGEHEIVETESGVSILLVRAEGQFYAVENLCTHDGGDLGGGPVEGTEIICPRHGARFCLRSGQALTAPAWEDVATHAVRIENGVVQVWDEPGEPGDT